MRTDFAVKKEFLETETFALFYNIDSSILKLNSIISNEGYEFVQIYLRDFELNFSEVFNIHRKLKPSQTKIISLMSGGFNSVSEEFFNAISHYFDLDLGDEENPPIVSVFLLKRKAPTTTEFGRAVDGSSSYRMRETKPLSEIRDFSNILIRKLRLIQSGQIELLGYFSILTNEREVLEKVITQGKNPGETYKINDNVIEKFKSLSELIHSIPEPLELALELFDSSYNTKDNKVKFILLMIGLESIFNVSSQNPIKHIISRHVAILLESNEDRNAPQLRVELFHKRTKDLGELYNFRSHIVHGSTELKIRKNIEQNLDSNLELITEYFRNVVLRIIWLKDHENDQVINNRTELFNYLNKKGFEG